jgi:hypothetical protein
MEIFTNPILWVVILAAEEIIAYSPLKANSMIQLVFQFLRMIKGKKR